MLKAFDRLYTGSAPKLSLRFFAYDVDRIRAIFCAANDTIETTDDAADELIAMRLSPAVTENVNGFAVLPAPEDVEDGVATTDVTVHVAGANRRLLVVDRR